MFILDGRLDEKIFKYLVDLITDGILEKEKIKAPLYASEYARYVEYQAGQGVVNE